MAKPPERRSRQVAIVPTPTLDQLVTAPERAKALLPEQARGLSWLQRRILVKVWEWTRFIEAHCGDHQRTLAHIWGVPWNSRSRREDEWTATDRAVHSRALARLERRGLLIRANDITQGKRTTRVRLTETGYLAAQRLTLVWREIC